MCILVAVYGLFQPYKSIAVNILEICVLSNFLLLLMLQSTQLIKDNYVVFPLPDAITEFNLTTTACQLYSGISTLTWILLPFYYLPLLSLLVVLGVALINYLRSISITCTMYCIIYYFFVYGELIFSIPSTEQGLCGPKNLLT